MDKKNFYVRLTKENKSFVVKQAKRMSLTYTAYMNYLLSKVREDQKDLQARSR